jgi:3'(2'), 5'-bisphosphate nucleotidase
MAEHKTRASDLDIESLCALAKEAGALILRYYEEGADIAIKEDASPVTEADIAANTLIVNALEKLAPDVAIVAEESDNTANIAEAPETYFLVDPLDGTKSFIKRTGHFTVNIGLIEAGVPTFGVVYVPVTNELYFTKEGKAYLDVGAGAEVISVRSPSEEGLIVVASKSHRTPETDAFIKQLKVKDLVSVSSSLKFCVVAKGEADIYPRFGPTMEWDTAAAHAVLVAAGGAVTMIDGSPFLYGKKAFRNTYFIARGKA